MKYDVFISYSRKDFDEVSSILESLKTAIPGLTYWFDITGIESGDEFEEKIIAAIDNSTYVLFALSENSIQSKWTKDEVIYAKNTGKKVIPVLLKGAHMKGWFLFKFGRVDCIDSTNSLQLDKLIHNLASWTAKPIAENKSTQLSGNNSAKPSVDMTSTPKHQQGTLCPCGSGKLLKDCHGKSLSSVSKVTADNKPQTQDSGNFVLKVKGVEYPMVFVEGGTFMMGSASKEAYEEEKPVHQVTLSSYSIGKYEVTQDLWEAVMGSNPSRFKGARKPVERVSWDDCQDFIQKLNNLTGKNFKLPTEAQWEYAARGGKKSKGYKYSGSDNIENVAWSPGVLRTHKVGIKDPNELGLYDMSGNVYEWCSDWYGRYGKTSETNPIGPTSGSDRVRRGGCWDSGSNACRVSSRTSQSPEFRVGYIGFRLCL